MPNYEKRIYEMEKQWNEKIKVLKEKIITEGNKLSDITPFLEDYEKRMQILEMPRARMLSVAKTWEPVKLPLLAGEFQSLGPNMSAS